MTVQLFLANGGKRQTHILEFMSLLSLSLAYSFSHLYAPYTISLCVCTLLFICITGCLNPSFVRPSFSLIEILSVIHHSMFNIFLKLTSNFKISSLGRVLNRFAKDIGCMDELLPTALHDVITVGLLFSEFYFTFFTFPNAFMTADCFKLNWNFISDWLCQPLPSVTYLSIVCNHFEVATLLPENIT